MEFVFCLHFRNRYTHCNVILLMKTHTHTHHRVKRFIGWSYNVSVSKRCCGNKGIIYLLWIDASMVFNGFDGPEIYRNARNFLYGDIVSNSIPNEFNTRFFSICIYCVLYCVLYCINLLRTTRTRSTQNIYKIHKTFNVYKNVHIL